MDRLLARLERRFGRFAIENLTTYIVGGMAIVFVIGMVNPSFLFRLLLIPALVPKEPWRLVTYLFIPESMSMYFGVFVLMFTYFIGTRLENAWGAFKLNVYYLLGMVGTTIAAYIVGAQGNFWLNASLFFALATLDPDHEIMIFFVVPVPIKWLALLSLAPIGYAFFEGGASARLAIGVALGNYVLFFGGHLVGLVRGQRVMMRQAQRRASFRAAPSEREETAATSRACAICGARQDAGADIRVCSCEKCGGPRDLCLEHARNH